MALPNEVLGREEKYLYAIATGDISVLPKEVIGRYEQYLEVIALNGGTGEHMHSNKIVLDKITQAHLDSIEQINTILEEVQG